MEDVSGNISVLDSNLGLSFVQSFSAFENEGNAVPALVVDSDASGGKGWGHRTRCTWERKKMYYDNFSSACSSHYKPKYTGDSVSGQFGYRDIFLKLRPLTLSLHNFMP